MLSKVIICPIILFALLVISPKHFNFVRAEALSEGAFAEWHAFLPIADELEDASISDHGAIINAVSVVHGAD